MTATKLLVLADAGAHSGFARVTHNVFERLQATGDWDISVLATNYRGDAWPTNLKLYVPNFDVRHDIFGQSRILELLGKIMPEAIVLYNDPAVVLNILLLNPWDADKVLWRGMPTPDGKAVYRPPIIAYMPIDGYDSPRTWDVIRQRCTRVSLSHFGRAAMPEASVIWHGVDPAIYKPIAKREAKKALGFDPAKFLILRVDKNSARKNYPDTWRALRPLLRAHPDMAVHFHCQPRSSDGHDLIAFTYNDEDIRDRLTFSPDLGGFTGWDEEHLATLYAAADVFVSTSWAEGWGLTLAEALACGTPVVATDCSAITEVVGPGGILIPPAGRIASPMGQDLCLPDIAGFTAAIERLHDQPDLRRDLGLAGVKHAKTMSWDTAAQQMATVIRNAIEGIAPS